MTNTIVTVRAVGHPTVFTYNDQVGAGIHARILESVGYTVIIRSLPTTCPTAARPLCYSDRAIGLLEDDMRDHESF